MKRENRRNIAGSVSQTSERGDMGIYLNNSESCDIGKKLDSLRTSILETLRRRVRFTNGIYVKVSR